MLLPFHQHMISITSMDSVFLLSPKYRLRFLQHAARLLGCAYICIWSPFPHQSSNHLSCIGAWLQDESDRGLTTTLFEEYRGSFCSIVRGCVPGWAFKDGLPYFELPDSELMSSASQQVQQQFYQESGIKTAVFLGCQNGEIELGMTTPYPADLQMNVHQVFSENFIQQSLMADLLQPPQDQPISVETARPSSSSSSLPSISVGSPEDSYLNILPGSQSLTSDSMASDPLIVPAPAHQLQMHAYGQYRNVQFPTPASDDEAMAKAILAVISSSTTSSSSLSPVGEGVSKFTGAFKAYKSGLGPRVESVKAGSVGTQQMFKAGLAMLRRMYWTSHQSRVEPEVMTRPTGNQLHHMISERKRREKINESFEALRKLLPPGSKKDKASVLSKTKDYVSTLKEEIRELEEKNKQLEMQLCETKQTQKMKTQEVGESSESIQIEVTRASAPVSTASQRVNLQIIVRDECDLTDLILRVLGCLKEIGAFHLVSVDASSETPRFAQVLVDFTLQVTADDYSEASLKEAVKKVVKDAVAHQSEML
ncbi:basic helix-loop-helix (bHLH) DNA-binding superfamily protein [Rhynchospora pubera]|uniref:Basic helix-loop-helix (BHLH) DNA-binding superfamily protein n=1 Tax=Rhynchospora pubera TaxID=906938 RepID=A0AAV8F733_9POAL|nr:basic helix-loop-helix (bHLH) DNA-binding superfamily protein [Rhynchospora pubera]